MRRPALSAVLTALVVALLAAVALADEASDPIPLNVATANDQDQAGLAPRPDGGFVAAWTSRNQDAVGADAVHARRFSSSGALDANEIHVEQNENNTQEYTSIASAPDGSFVVVWQTYTGVTNGMEVVARRYNADGTPATGELAVNQTVPDSQVHPEVGMASDGSFVVVWEMGEDPGPSDDGAVFARRFNANGTAASGELVVGATQTDDGEPQVAVEPGGAFVVTWMDYRANLGDVMVRRFTAANSPAWAAKPVHDVLTGSQSYMDVAITADGFVVVWRQGSSGSDIHLRRFLTDGSATGPAVTVHETLDGTQADPWVAVASDGAIGVAYDDFTSSVYFRRFNADLTPATASHTVISGSNAASESITATGSQFVVGYTATDASGQGVYARRYTYVPSGGGGGTPTPDPGATATPTQTPTQTATPTGTPVPLPKFSEVVSLPSTRKCVSRRSFRIRIRQQSSKIVSAVVKVNGKRVATRRGARITAPVNLKGLPKGRFKVEITVTLADGRKIKGTRRYRTCTKRRPGSNRSPV